MVRSTPSRSYALVHILSLIVPMLGFVIGLYLYLRPSAEDQHAGVRCLKLAALSIAVQLAVSGFFIWWVESV